MDRLSTNGQMLSQLELRNAPHSSFDLRNHNFLSGKLGKLIVSRVDEIYPGDRLVGNVENVINFEPLAAPLMGSMVNKQESFYVPWSVVWRHAHDFFTGKNGFSKPMPSVSPRDVFIAYGEYELIPDLTRFIQGFHFAVADNQPSDAFRSNLLLNVNRFLSHILSATYSFGLQYKVLDLFSPIFKKYQNIIYKPIDLTGDSIDPQFSDDFITLLDQCVTHCYALSDQSPAQFDVNHEAFWNFITPILDCVEFHYNFFFGVSSHLDYIGWPIMDDWHNYFYGDSASKNINGSKTKDSFIRLFDYEYFESKLVDDAFTFPTGEELFSNISNNWLYLRAFYAIWYWNYRDQLLEADAMNPETDEFMGDSVSQLEIVLCTILRVRCWYKDTFTTALTNTGDGNLSVPLTSTVTANLQYEYYDDQSKLIDTKDYQQAFQAGATMCRITAAGGFKYDIPMNYLSQTFDAESLHTSQSAAFSLDMLDRVSRLRRFLMKKFILGYEYDDVLWSNFMVKLSNVRMHIPELLSRGRDEVAINTVVNNTNTQEQIAGDKTAVAWSNGRASDVNYFAEEHGCYISIMTVLPVQSYTGGMSRHWQKLKPFDFAWPDFATMGMDAVYNYELCAPRGAFRESGLDDQTATAVFGYQGRYYDLKSKLDEQHGRLRTDLQFLTWSREFNMNNLPKLNYMFVHCWPNVNPFVVADDEDVFRADVSHNLDFQRRFPVPSEIV